MKKVIDHFKITTYYSDGDVHETIRHTREGLAACIKNIWKDKSLVRFTVEEVV
tara:strand:- start:143 stop:301 length:159 start_codon:yes stop_codon:yes gene_type:complete